MGKIFYFHTYADKSTIIIRNLLLNFLLLLAGISYSQSYTFSPCGATGAVGPTQLQVGSGYFATNLNGSVTISGQGIQQFTVPTSGAWIIETRGARGYCPGGFGGRGAIIRGEFILTAGTVLKIVVGQEGQVNPAAGTLQFGGGGGSFVALLNNTPLCVAGGGGGSHATSYAASTADGTVVTTGNTGAGSTSGIGGTGGGGGAASSSANGGAGFTADGGGTTGPALSFINGALGGNVGAVPYANGGIGGFGGGGGTQSWNNNRGGGGGGYSGGGGGQLGQPTCWGGGGGSFNTGTNQVNSSGANAFSDGLVIITAACNINLTNSSTTGPGPICFGNSATLTTNAISNYVWSTGATTSSITVSPTVTTQYTLTATSPSNCTASSVITVSVQNTVPTVTATTSNNSVCAGNAVILTATGANTYTWTNGVTNGVSYMPTATNIYTVTGGNACGVSTATVGVTVNTSPIVLAGVNTPTVCNGGAVTFTSGGNATTYVWTNGVVSGTPYFPSATANYMLTGTANGCSSVVVVAVAVLVTPTIVPVATPTSVCLGVTATLSAVGASGYTWSPGTNPNSSTLAVSPLVSTTYTLVRTNGICASTTTVMLVVSPLPLVSATGSPAQICAGTGVNLNVLGAITYTWLPGNFTAANFTLFPNISTCYTVTGSNGSCTAVSAVCVTVNPNPVISISSPTNEICEGQNVLLTANGTSGLTYTWTPTNSNNLTQSFSPPTTTLITLSATNSFSCTSSVTQLMLVNSVPAPSLTSSVPYLCAGISAVLSVANPSNNVVYGWGTGPIGPSIPVSPSVTTTYTVTGTNTITGCASTNTISLAVYISTFSVNGPTAICVGQTASLSVTGAATSYSWNINGGIIAPSVTVAPVLTTPYNITGINGSCQSSVNFPVVVNPLPNVIASVAKSTICRFEIATISANGATTYTWDNGSNASVLTFTLNGTTTYTLTGTNDQGCSKTTTVTQYVATCIGLEDPSNNGSFDLNIYPNPNNGNFTIKADVNTTLQLVNALGQLISTIKITEDNKKEVTINNLSPGIYFITGQSDGRKVNKKVIIER